MLTSILYYISLYARRTDMSTIYLTRNTNDTDPIHEDRYLLRAMTPEACRCRVTIQNLIHRMCTLAIHLLRSIYSFHSFWSNSSFI